MGGGTDGGTDGGTATDGGTGGGMDGGTQTEDKAPVITSQPASLSVLVGGVATFGVVASGTAPLSYQWKLGGQAISGATSANYSIASATAANGGSYTVTVSNSVGSVTSNAATLNVCDSSIDNGVCVTCPSGYKGGDGHCTDIDECASGVPPCGTTASACINTLGSYKCTCIAGFSAPPTGGQCTDVDECSTGTDTCDHDPQACSNTWGSFTCSCPADFSGNGQGANGCLLTTPGLASLLPSAGTLSPAFVSSTTTYTLTLPTGTTSVSLTPSIQFPAHASIQVEGAAVTSGTASTLIRVGIPPRAVSITVTTDAGQSRSYTVVLQHSLTTYIKASNTGANDYFGSTLALSADGLTLAVGAYGEGSNAKGVGGNQDDNSAGNAGAVYVFTRTGTQWVQQAYIKASNTEASDIFGSALSLSADGSTLAVGAYGEDSNAMGVGGNQDDNSAVYAGAVYVFTRTGAQWSQQAYIKASNTEATDSFGSALTLSANGSTLAVGAYSEDSNAKGVGGNQDDNSAGIAGAVYVFTRTGVQWSQQAYIKASNTEATDYFGLPLALSADGSTLAVGAYGEDSNAMGVGGNQDDNAAGGAGAVYVFTRTGTQWTQQAYVKASNTEANDIFGFTLALSADGSTLAVGTNGEDSNAMGVGGNQGDNSARNAGAVYVF